VVNNSNDYFDLIPTDEIEKRKEPNVSIIVKPPEQDIIDEPEIIEESLSLQDKEKEMIQKALDKHNGKRKAAAKELGISERTLYRKIKEYNIK
jgi:transcriptional regulator with PAS, ATPase and Fis domain